MYHRLYTSHVYACLHVCVSVITNTLFQLHKCVAERQTVFMLRAFILTGVGLMFVSIMYVVLRLVRLAQILQLPACCLPPSLVHVTQRTNAPRALSSYPLPTLTHMYKLTNVHTDTHTHSHSCPKTSLQTNMHTTRKCTHDTHMRARAHTCTVLSDYKPVNKLEY